MNCLVCGMRADDEDVIEPVLEAKGNETVRVCELCACDIAQTLFTSRTVTVKVQDGMLSMEVL